MIISIPKESFRGEKRVALTPESATQIQKLGHTLRIQSGAGKAAEFSDADYKAAGVEVVKGEAIWKDTDFILSLGGGTPCYANNMDVINSYANLSSYYLKALPVTIKNRLLLQRDQRPLVADLSDEELHEFIAKHLFERSFYYEQAKMKIIIDNKSIDAIVKEISELQ